jgi:hypothetical protein
MISQYDSKGRQKANSAETCGRKKRERLMERSPALSRVFVGHCTLGFQRNNGFAIKKTSYAKPAVSAIFPGAYALKAPLAGALKNAETPILARLLAHWQGRENAY